MLILVTGSSGLIGSEAVTAYDQMGHDVIGVDNNLRATFFGEKGDTLWNLDRLKNSTNRFSHESLDIRDRDAIDKLFKQHEFDLIIHCAAQPSHDRAAAIPLLDFDVNAGGTINLLEATRQHCPEAVFCHMSTNKVYGDRPNTLNLKELETRWEYADAADFDGITEDMSIDQSKHSLFGASKAAADVIVQEYGRYFDMKTAAFRGGCLTGPSHSGVELHGFLNYLVKCVVHGKPYTVFGYKGKQVRDNIHSHDVVQAFEAFRKNPRCGEVYNLGGGRGNSVSMIEAIGKIETMANRKLNWTYSDQNRAGDHICYISNLMKMKAHFSDWDITIDLDTLLEQMVKAEMDRF